METFPVQLIAKQTLHILLLLYLCKLLFNKNQLLLLKF